MLDKDLIFKKGESLPMKQTGESALIYTLYNNSTFQQIDYTSFSLDDVIALAENFYDCLDYNEDFDEYVLIDNNPLAFLNRVIGSIRGASTFDAPILKKRKRTFI